jgi:hypothetical protein
MVNGKRQIVNSKSDAEPRRTSEMFLTERTLSCRALANSARMPGSAILRVHKGFTPGLEEKLPDMRTLTVALILLVCFSPAFAQYPPLAVHPDYQGPSGEPGQIKLDGIVTKVSLFHGRSDDEADWHCYIDLSPKASTELSDYLRARGLNVDAAKLDILYSELMTLDKYKFTWFDDKFYSADLTSSFLLFKPGSAHPAWDLGVKAIDNQGTEHDFSSFTKLIGARAYLQGPLVNDADHGTRVEIHPSRFNRFRYGLVRRSDCCEKGG